jgi:hypothetical protein
MMPIVKNRRHPAVTTPEDARRVLVSVDIIPVHPVTWLALRLLALTTLRPGEQQHGRRIEIERLDDPEPVRRKLVQEWADPFLDGMSKAAELVALPPA